MSGRVGQRPGQSWRDARFHRRMVDVVVGCFLLDYSPMLDLAAWLQRHLRDAMLAEPSSRVVAGCQLAHEWGGNCFQQVSSALPCANLCAVNALATFFLAGGNSFQFCAHTPLVPPACPKARRGKGRASRARTKVSSFQMASFVTRSAA